MTRVNILLLVILLASASYLVHTSYEARRLYIELDRQTTRANELALENERLQIERREQATPQRTKGIATDRLGMRAASPSAIQTVTVPAAGGAR